MEKRAFKMHFFPLLLIVSLVSLSHQYQTTTTTPESKIDDYLVTENNREDEVIEAAGDHLGKRCYTVDEAAEFCNAFGLDSGNSNERVGGLEESDQIDLNNIYEEINKEDKDEMIDSTDSKNNWRVGSMESQNRHFLESGNFSDITFILGPENDTQIIRAHKMMLVRASPMFESILKASTSGNKERRIRVTDISTGIFKSFLEYVYTGKLCFAHFDEACEMLSVASRFQMPDLAKFCHYYLWLNMYPSNLWGAYQCAVSANDTSMAETALSVIQRKTDEALMDSAFSKIPQTALVAFLQRNELNVTSELSLYQASLRWAMADAERQGLPQEPESLRACLGPALQHIRFLTLTPNEFANIQYTSKVLSYSESLAVIFNLNAPGVMPLPKDLSSNKNKRQLGNFNGEYFDILEKPSSSSTCEDIDLKTETSIFDVLGTTYFMGDSLTDPLVMSIKVPKRHNISNDINCNFEDEDLTIIFLDSNDNKIYTQRYKTECSDDQSQDSLNSITYNVALTNAINIPAKHELYRIKIIFHKSGRYPYSLSSGDAYAGNPEYFYDQYRGHRYKYERFLGNNNFVYSICNY